MSKSSVMCTSGEFSQVNTISHNTLWTVHYYLLYQRTPIATCSRRIPYYAITCINQSPKLLKLIGWRHCPCFRWVCTYPEPQLQFSGTESSRTARYSV